MVSGPIRPSTYITSEYALFFVLVLAHRGFCTRAPRLFRARRGLLKFPHLPMSCPRRYPRDSRKMTLPKRLSEDREHARFRSNMLAPHHSTDSLKTSG